MLKINNKHKNNANTRNTNGNNSSDQTKETTTTVWTSKAANKGRASDISLVKTAQCHSKSNSGWTQDRTMIHVLGNKTEPRT